MKKLKLIGNILTVLAIVFVLRRLDSEAWRAILVPEKLPAWLLFLALYTLIVLASFIPWQVLVCVFSERPDTLQRNKSDFCFIFCKANIMKYVPGNVFQYVGRNEIADVLALDHVNVAMATLSEVLLMVFTALVISLVLIGAYTLAYLQGQLLRILLLALAVLLLLGLLGWWLFRKKKEKLREYYLYYKRILTSKRAVRTLLLCTAAYAVIFACIGLLFVLVLRTCTQSRLEGDSLRVVIGAFILSWLAGYITPGAPGGIGVRELIMTLVFSGGSILQPEAVIAAVAAYRIVNTLGDVAAFAIAFAVKQICRRKKPDRSREEIK